MPFLILVKKNIQKIEQKEGSHSQQLRLGAAIVTNLYSLELTSPGIRNCFKPRFVVCMVNFAVNFAIEVVFTIWLCIFSEL